MFESLSDRLQTVFQKLGGKGKLTEDDVRESMKQVRIALLEADVNLKVVKEFVANVTEKAIGEEVTKSLTPAQQVVKIVHDELVSLLGTDSVELIETRSGPINWRSSYVRRVNALYLSPPMSIGLLPSRSLRRLVGSSKFWCIQKARKQGQQIL